MWHTLAIHAAASLPWGKIIAAVIGVQLTIAGLVTLLVLSVTVETEQTDTRGDCTVTVNSTGLDVEGLNDAQLAHAATIVQVGRQRALPDQAIRVALAVAAQESKFRNYANDGTGDLRPDQRGVSRSLAYPHDAVGRDHGSVNVFQQQYPWWGTLDELMDPVYAAGKFYDTLLDVPGWEQLPLTVAAQRVQRSAFPNAYAQWESLADEVLTALSATSARPAGAVASPGAVALEQTYASATERCQDRAVPADFTALPGAYSGEVAVNVAASWIGTPYSWGGGTTSGPSEGFAQGAGIVGFDCSGLILHAWYQAAGITLPHSSVAIEAMSTPVPPSQAQAGDILSFATAGGSRVSHDGLFDGRGGMIHAPRTGKTVEYVPDVLNDPYWSDVLVSITRPPLPAGPSSTNNAPQAAGLASWSLSEPRRTVTAW
ncbi:C40 family peptidase [Jannaschia sp. R86511]|uniref:C40 family peptidase n=1 Tax=Jannaschia sp. R86511 TaxID=3093853 RepID=UPI0036D3BF7E